MREQQAEWHEKYTLPSLWDYFRANRTNHGSYFYNWTTWDEVAWRNFYRVWMQFLNDYKNKGGRVTVSEDAAFIYSLFGFATIEEMELLQEAGFHPLSTGPRACSSPRAKRSSSASSGPVFSPISSSSTRTRSRTSRSSMAPGSSA
jgi:hypothetical protein